MRLSLFAGATTALLLSACSRRQEAPPAPPAYSEVFGDHPDAAALYRELRARNVVPPELDRGCAAIAYSPDGVPDVQVAGAGDRKIVPCEIDEFVLEKSSDFPDLVKQIAGGDIPWSLDHPMISETIALLDRILAERKLRPDSEEYRERKAFGLFLLATVPFRGWEEALDASSPGASAKNERFKGSLRAIARQAEDMGLGELNLRLEAKGGLGTLSDFSVEHTAAEAVKQGVGDCTEMSKILYAAFRQAGFEPFFVRIDPWKSEHPGVRELIQADPNYFHVVIGLKLRGRTVLYDPGLVAYDPPHKQAVPLTLRQYLSLDFINRGNARAQQGKLEEAMKAQERAGRLDPSSDVVPVNRSVYFARKGEFDKALEELERSIRIHPAKADYYYYRGLVHVQMREPRAALADFDLAVQKNPDNPVFYYDRGVTRGNTGNIAGSVSDFTTYVRISPAPDLERVRKFLKFVTHAKWTRSQVSPWRGAIEGELGTAPEEVEAQIFLARILWEANHREEARKEANALLKIQRPGKGFSEPALEFVKSAFDFLPEPIRKEPAFEAKRKSLLQ